MTIEELIPKIMEHASEYAVESEEQIFVGMEPVRRHKRWKTQKKWLKRFGQKPVYQTKKCHRIDVDIPMILDFCAKFGYPIPMEIMNMMETNEGGGINNDQRNYW